MSLLTEAREILQAAEKSLRALMRTGIQSGRYGDVAQIAEMAQALGRTIGNPLLSTNAFTAARVPMDLPAVEQHAPSTETSLKKGRGKADYPKFERDGDRLVKVGWSKRQKAEYEHRVPRGVATCVCFQLGNAGANAFRMEQRLPLKLEDGSEVPSYQSYLVLAWLRHIGVVEKRANDSYQWVAEENSDSSFEKIWDATPRRGGAVRGKN